MSTVLHPVGPQRARVYWVRRLVVLVLLGALVALAATAVTWVRGRADAPTAAAAQEQGAEADAASAADDGGEAETDEPATATPVDCGPEVLQVTLTTSAVELAPTTNPVLTATVTNVGDEPCTVDAGDATREVLITSGEDRIWSTKDCATPETASRQLLLAAGAADAVPIEWPRVRSAEGCPADLPAPRAGTYQAVASLGATGSQTVVFLLR